MDKVLLHPLTASNLKAYMTNPGAPLMLVGGEGSGKLLLARTLAAEALELDSLHKLDNLPFYRQIERPEDKQNILIDQIRQTKLFLKLKTTGKQSIRRAVVIANAQDMNAEAQNALLKILEEPTPDTLFILTAISVQSVLPTISSRTQRIEVRPVSLDDSLKFFAKNNSKDEIEQAWNLSQGNAGLLFSLLSSTEEHPLKVSIERVKSLLGMSAYHRQIELGKIAKDRDELKELITALNLILNALHRSAINKGNTSQANTLLKDRKLVQKIAKYLGANVSTKLAVSELNLKLKV